MENSKTLSCIFNETKGELAVSLSGLSLPKDVQKIQDCITKYLNQVFGEDNEYRQNLTQSEDYILQAALSMLNAQRNLVSALSSYPKVESLNKKTVSPEQTTYKKSSTDSSVSSPNALLGSGGGALVGNLFFGGWGAVFGAIAGTAIVLYTSQQTSQTKAPDLKSEPKEKTHEVAKATDVPVNVNALVDVVGQLCDSLDRLITTFRAQIQRVINKYESQEKPTIEREYRVLIEGIQSLVGFKRGHSDEDPRYLNKLQTRIEDLVELLDNYDLTLVDYSDNKAHLFDELSSSNVTEPKMVTPALMKNGEVIIRGKVFVKSEK